MCACEGVVAIVGVAVVVLVIYTPTEHKTNGKCPE